MATTEILLNGRTYRIACDDGQEVHLAHLGGMVDSRIKSLLTAAPHMSETMALVMASLMIADEAHDLKGALSRASQAQPPAAAAPRPANVGGAEMETAVTATLHGIAERIEAIAEYMEMQ